jgi:hypothetical protein
VHTPCIPANPRSPDNHPNRRAEPFKNISENIQGWTANVHPSLPGWARDEPEKHHGNETLNAS